MRPTAHRPVTIFLLATIYLFEEITNYSIGAGFSAALVIICVALASIPRDVLQTPIGKLQSLLGITLFVAYQFISLSLSPDDCAVGMKSIFSICMIIVVAWAVYQVQPATVFAMDRVSKGILIAILLALLAGRMGVDAMSILAEEVRTKSGFYSEPSHLALHLIPLIAYRLLTNFRDPVSWCVIGASLIFVSSATLTAPVVAIIGLTLASRAKNLLIAIVLPAAVGVGLVWLLSNFSNNPLLDKFMAIASPDLEGVTVLSSTVWLNGWSQGFEHFTASSGLGVGFNQMGCGSLSTAGFFSPLVAREGFILNNTDGSFIFSKMVSENGLAGLLLCLYLTIKSAAAIIEWVRSKRHFSFTADQLQPYAIRAAGGLTLLIHFYLRGMSYFIFPLIIGVCFLLHDPANKPSLQTRVRHLSG